MDGDPRVTVLDGRTSFEVRRLAEGARVARIRSMMYGIRLGGREWLAVETFRAPWIPAEVLAHDPAEALRRTSDRSTGGIRLLVDPLEPAPADLRTVGEVLARDRGDRARIGTVPECDTLQPGVYEDASVDTEAYLG